MNLIARYSKIGLFIVTSVLVRISSRLSVANFGSSSFNNYRDEYHYQEENKNKIVNYRQVEKNILDKILSPTIYDSQIRWYPNQGLFL